ncbi:MAG: DedA family protein [Candidatus Marinimicrobia bacterium]|nr:DedA family protein [Candidatus Neomarinimicrobiota bacterium]
MDSFLYTFENFPISLVYIILSVLMFMEYITPFVPGDTFLAFSAYLAGIGILSPEATFLMAIIANILGFSTIYYVAHRWGKYFLEKRNFKFLPYEKIQKTEFYFKKYGYWLILINRFLPGTRFFITLTAGLCRMNFRISLFLNTLSVALWSGLLLGLGLFVGKNWGQIKVILSRYNLYVTLGIIVVITALFIYKLTRKKKTGVQT